MTDMTEQAYRAVTDWWHNPPEETPCKCASCDWQGMGDKLDEIGDCSLTPGDPSPAGRCPDCGALAYVVQPEPAPDPRDALIADLVAALTSIRNGCAETGRWIDDETSEAVDGGPDDDVPGATWEPYTEEETALWHEGIVAKCDEALAKVAAAEAREG